MRAFMTVLACLLATTPRTAFASAESPVVVTLTRSFGLSMRYDEIGRIASNQQAAALVLPGGRARVEPEISHDFAYAYSPDRPHAATSIGGRRLAYDFDGNQVGFTQPDTSHGPATRTLVWDAEDRMRRVDDGRGAQPVSFVYDADRARTQVRRAVAHGVRLAVLDGAQ